MAEVAIYLLESGVLLALLYLLYLLLLQKETFFDLNRFYLLGIPVVSLLFPLLSFELLPQSESLITQPVAQLSNVRSSYYEALSAWTHEASGARSADPGVSGDAGVGGVDYNWLLFISFLSIYGLGVVILFFRLAWTCVWIGKLLYANPVEIVRGVKVVKVPHRIAPFSFMNHVFVHTPMFGREELSRILEHEKTHIRERHSFDLVFVQLLGAFLWFNPAVWLLIKSLKETHEYIADKKMIDQGYSLVEYQTLLLRQLISNNSFGLVHNFNLSFIKKRITMMNNTKSGWSGKIRVSVAIVATLVLSTMIFQCNSSLENQFSKEARPEGVDGLIQDVKVPVLPKIQSRTQYELTDAVNLSAMDNKLFVDGKQVDLGSLSSAIDQAELSERGVVVFQVDENQKMVFIRKVQMELRKANRRKLLYLGKTENGETVEVPFLLPPVQGTSGYSGTVLPVIDDQYLEEHNMDMLKIYLGDHAGNEYQKTVYDFVLSQLARKRNYVVSAKYHDNDTYGSYLSNLTYIREGFNQLYQERARELFGMDFHELEDDDYRTVRKGIPMAISIAD